MVPLDGDENSFSYNSRTCEHILAEATGRDQKKSARWVTGQGEAVRCVGSYIKCVQGNVQKMEENQ